MNPESMSLESMLRTLALDGQTELTPAALLVMYNWADEADKMFAVSHPNFPFKVRFLHELKLYPATVKVSQMACVIDRAEDYKKFLKAYKFTEVDMDEVPRSWLVALLEK